MDNDPFPLSHMFLHSLTEDKIEKIKAELEAQPRMAIISLPGQSIEIRRLYQDRAIKILRSITELEPYFRGCDDDRCYFCDNPASNHTDNCPYLLAKQLLQEIDNG